MMRIERMAADGPLELIRANPHIRIIRGLSPVPMWLVAI